MKKLFILSGVFLLTLLLSSNVYAAERNGDDNKRGESDSSEQEDDKGNGYQSMMKEENNNTGTSSQERERNEVKVQNMASSTDDGEKELSQRRSRVAETVQELLSVADRVGGIGEQIRVIAREQNENQEKIEEKVQKIENRNAITKFFFGADEEEVDSANELIDGASGKIEELKELKEKLFSESDKEVIEKQILNLEQINSEIKNILDEAKKTFSLFGWLFR